LNVKINAGGYENKTWLAETLEKGTGLLESAKEKERAILKIVEEKIAE